jgi:hypothetical protein
MQWQSFGMHQDRQVVRAYRDEERERRLHQEG